MGKYFDSKFNKNDNSKCECTKCRMGLDPDNEVDVDVSFTELQLDDPNDILQTYFEAMDDVDTEEEAWELMAGLFSEGVRYGMKTSTLEDIKANIEFLNFLEYDFDDGT